MSPKRAPAKVGRLRKRSEFLAVRAGRKKRGPLFLLEELDRKAPGEGPRVGFTVTKKVGNAVVRNRVRRRLKEAVRVQAADAMRPGHDYVVVGRREALDAGFRELAAELAARIGRRRL